VTAALLSLAVREKKTCEKHIKGYFLKKEAGDATIKSL